MGSAVRYGRYVLASLLGVPLACGEPGGMTSAELERAIARDLQVTARYELFGEPIRLRVLISATNQTDTLIEGYTGFPDNGRWLLRAYATPDRDPPPVWRWDGGRFIADIRVGLFIPPGETITDTLVFGIGSTPPLIPAGTHYMTAILSYSQQRGSDPELGSRHVQSPEFPIGEVTLERAIAADLRVTARYDLVGEPIRLRVRISATNHSDSLIEGYTGPLLNGRWLLRAYPTTDRDPPPIWRSEDGVGVPDIPILLSIPPGQTITDTLVLGIGDAPPSIPAGTHYMTAILRFPSHDTWSPEFPIDVVVVPPPGGGIGRMR